MIKTTLITIAWVMVVGLVLIWLLGGGWSATVRTVKSLRNPLDYVFNNESGIPLIKLPWTPGNVRGPDISEYAAQADVKLASMGDDTDTTTSAPDNTRAQNFGVPSPHRGKVAISENNATADTPSEEYVTIEAREGNGAPIDLTGWSLQSAVSGVRVGFPAGAELFTQGKVNDAVSIFLDPGATAVIATGRSPVGISFRENRCSGYLAQMQVFAPPIDNVCPSPREILPATAENIKVYGSNCIDYVQSMPRCYFPPSGVPSSLSSACRSYIGSNMTYNGCVAMYKARPSFFGAWRIYLGRASELWSNEHDVIRLLDGEGRTVDVLQY